MIPRARRQVDDDRNTVRRGGHVVDGQGVMTTWVAWAGSVLLLLSATESSTPSPFPPNVVGGRGRWISRRAEDYRVINYRRILLRPVK